MEATTKTVIRTVRLPREIDEELKRAARRNRRTVTGEILLALDRYLETRPADALGADSGK